MYLLSFIKCFINLIKKIHSFLSIPITIIELNIFYDVILDFEFNL